MYNNNKCKVQYSNKRTVQYINVSSHNDWYVYPTVDPTEVKVTARTSVVVTNSAQTFQWTDQGVNLHIPSDSLPTDVGRCVLQIFSSMSGNYQFPDNHELISTVIWVRCDPPCQFRKAITLELQHCAKKGSSEKLSFVRAVCSQKETDQPYSFGLKGHGSFTEKSSYGCIPLYHFSGIAVTTEAPNDRLYTASLYYLSRDIHRWDIHLVVTWDVEAHNTVRNVFLHTYYCIVYSCMNN